MHRNVSRPASEPRLPATAATIDDSEERAPSSSTEWYSLDVADHRPLDWLSRGKETHGTGPGAEQKDERNPEVTLRRKEFRSLFKKIRKLVRKLREVEEMLVSMGDKDWLELRRDRQLEEGELELDRDEEWSSH
jgi:hypothetical protein